MTLQEKIKVNTVGLLNSFHSLTPAQVKFKPSENSWNILECVEHIFLVDESVSKILKTPAPEKVENDKPELFGYEKLNHILVTKRIESKITAPDFVTPAGHFKNIDDAEKNINLLMEKIISHLDANDISKELHTIKHPRLGEMTKTDWIHFLITHTNRHIIQIEEVKKML